MCPAFPPICSQSPGPRRIAGIRRKTFHCKGRYMLPGDFAGQLCQWGCGWKGGFQLRRRFRFRCTGPAGRHFRSDSCTSRRPPGSKRRFSEEEGFFSVPAGSCADFSVSGIKIGADGFSSVPILHSRVYPACQGFAAGRLRVRYSSSFSFILSGISRFTGQSTALAMRLAKAVMKSMSSTICCPCIRAMVS